MAYIVRSATWAWPDEMAAENSCGKPELRVRPGVGADEAREASNLCLWGWVQTMSTNPTLETHEHEAAGSVTCDRPQAVMTTLRSRGGSRDQRLAR